MPIPAAIAAASRAAVRERLGGAQYASSSSSGSGVGKCISRWIMRRQSAAPRNQLISPHRSTRPPPRRGCRRGRHGSAPVQAYPKCAKAPTAHVAPFGSPIAPERWSSSSSSASAGAGAGAVGRRWRRRGKGTVADGCREHQIWTTIAALTSPPCMPLHTGPMRRPGNRCAHRRRRCVERRRGRSARARR